MIFENDISALIKFSKQGLVLVVTENECGKIKTVLDAAQIYINLESDFSKETVLLCAAALRRFKEMLESWEIKRPDIKCIAEKEFFNTGNSAFFAECIFKETGFKIQKNEDESLSCISKLITKNCCIKKTIQECGGSNLLINRDLSWLDFNERVVMEAAKKDLPLLERFRFLCIAALNFEEFFMVRVAYIKNEAIKESENGILNIDNETACGNFDILQSLNSTQLLKAVQKRISEILQMQYNLLTKKIIPKLAVNGINYISAANWTDLDREYLNLFFLDEVFYSLTPLRFDDQTETSINSRIIYAAFLLEKKDSQNTNYTGEKKDKCEYISLVQVPRTIQRIVNLPNKQNGKIRWTLLDDVVVEFSEKLFSGFTIKEKIIFKIYRDADVPVDERRDEDFVNAMEEIIVSRKKSNTIRMMCKQNGNSILCNKIREYLNLKSADIDQVPDMPDLGSLIDLSYINGFENLKAAQDTISAHPEFADFVNDERTLWQRIDEHDILLHLPYQSFDAVVRFFSFAAQDKNVIAIKTTLYRTARESLIVDALKKAARNGKHVTVIVELKARFDEERNIIRAKDLEKAGIIVVYGLANLKVHAKMSLIVRRENNIIKRYAHISTGNYNEKTAKLYCDLSFFTSNKDFTYDAALLFNMITGYSSFVETRRFIVSPLNLKEKILIYINNTIESVKKGACKIRAKLNALTDPQIIEALYRASSAGVKINLLVRSSCCLVPGIKGMSENIRVISIIDHFLEHSRIISFQTSTEAGEKTEVFLSSADWMNRNLERRMELMFPILDSNLKNEICGMLDAYFADNCTAAVLGQDGFWKQCSPENEQSAFRVQKYFEQKALKDSRENKKGKNEFVVRRN
ncbi:MAG: polyphosphate kinase 1 [Spirochaetaceae bacterium]|jgi:polyphosphate kinase|nr:polyphosphate kinase 1 [Spirochaetaceae bacterium]